MVLERIIHWSARRNVLLWTTWQCRLVNYVLFERARALTVDLLLQVAHLLSKVVEHDVGEARLTQGVILDATYRHALVV